MVDDRSRYEEALRRGHSYSWDQRWTEAIPEFEIAVGAQADQPAAYAGLGLAYYELGKLDKALEYYKLASRFSHGDIIYLKHVADVQERLGLLDQAGQTYMALGEIQLRRKKLDEAVVSWLRAVSLKPDLLGAHQRLVAVYRRQGLISNAIREYLIVAELYGRRGEKDLALKVCRLALELDPRNAEVMTAVELIRQGKQLTPADSPAVIFDRLSSSEDGKTNFRAGLVSLEHGIIYSAQRVAQQSLAQEILSEGDDGLLASEQTGGTSKLARTTLISQALEFQTRDMVDEAIDCFEQVLDTGLISAAAHFCLGLLYQVQKRPSQAIGELEQAAADPTLRPASYYAIGEAYRLRGDNVRATENFVESLKYIDLDTVDREQSNRIIEQYGFLVNGLLSGPEPVRQARFVHGLVTFLGDDRWQENIVEARRRLDNLSAEGQTFILGDIFAAGSIQVLQSLSRSQEYADIGKYDSAVEEAYRAIQLSPYYLASHTQLAELMVRQDRIPIAVTKYLTIGDTCWVRGDINGAFDNYERAVELSPLNLFNRAKLIEVLSQEGQIDRALEHYLLLGEVYYNLAEMDKARNTYLEGLKLVPEGTDKQQWRSRLLRAIADIDMQRLDWNHALIAYSELSAATPNDKDVALKVVDLYFKVGQPEKAVQRVDQTLGLMVKNGRSAEVTGILEELVDQWPDDENLVNRLTRLYLHQGKRQEAIALLDTLGETQLNSGNTEQAVRTIQKILQLDPPNSISYQKLLQRLEQEHA